ncbi:MAG: hypothetical protein IKF52_06360 [Clostridia bacterium]|nr:hypothetical protein [Clostridia bacterium]
MKKKKNKKKNKFIIIISVIVIIFFMLILIGVQRTINKKNQVKDYDDISDFESIREILEYSNCEYISEKNSEDSECDIDINLTFPVKLMEDGKSNEVFFNNVIKRVGNIIGFESFRLIDDKNDIKIKVICDEDTKSIISIYINGETNYFKKRISKQNANQYQETQTTKFDINSEEIKLLIQNNWKPINFGTKESTFDKYDIYFDEGIKVRNISNNVYNIVFTKKYSGNVINNITTKTSLEEIKKDLGNETFGSIDDGVIGYKGENIYVFFSEGEISIYGVKIAEYDDFNDLLNQYIEKNDVLDFMDKLTDLWPDYYEYDYDSNYLYISYPLKGVRIEYNVSEKNGIKLYKEYLDKCQDLKSLNKGIESGILIIENSNLLYLSEEERINKYLDFGYISSMNIKDDNKSELFYSNVVTYADGSIEKIQFQSKTGEYPDSELEKPINSYLWVSDNIIVYSIKNQGIYLYDIIRKEIGTLVTGEDEFELKEYKDNILKYDDKEINIQ